MLTLLRLQIAFPLGGPLNYPFVALTLLSVLVHIADFSVVLSMLPSKAGVGWIDFHGFLSRV